MRLDANITDGSSQRKSQTIDAQPVNEELQIAVANLGMVQCPHWVRKCRR